MIFIWFIFILIEAIRNYYIIEISKSTPDYLQSFILRGMASILHGIFCNVQDLEQYFYLVVFQTSSFWLLFDLTLNLLRKKDIFYLGENSLIDKLFKRMGKVVLIFAKVTALIICIVMFFIVTK